MADLLPPLLKIFHLAGIVLWLGPTIAGWFYLVAARHHTQCQSRHAVSKLELWVRRKFLDLVHLEHLGLLLLLLGGAGRILLDPAWLDQPWVVYKIWIVAAIIAPLELADIYFSNVLLNRALKKLRMDRNDEESLAMLKKYDRFFGVASILLAVTLPVLFWLAVFRPHL